MSPLRENCDCPPSLRSGGDICDHCNGRTPPSGERTVPAEPICKCGHVRGSHDGPCDHKRRTCEEIGCRGPGSCEGGDGKPGGPCLCNAFEAASPEVQRPTKLRMDDCDCVQGYRWNDGLMQNDKCYSCDAWDQYFADKAEKTKLREVQIPEPMNATIDKSLARDLVTAGWCARREAMNSRTLAEFAALSQREINDIIEFTTNDTLKQQSGNHRASPRPTPAEALFAFMGWLTSRSEIAGPFSEVHPAAPAADLVSEFCQSQGWTGPDGDWTQKLKPYPAASPRPTDAG